MRPTNHRGGYSAGLSRRILGRLIAAVQDLSELRNQAGDGHGATMVVTVEPRHGRLAVWAALAWCGFMLEAQTP